MKIGHVLKKKKNRFNDEKMGIKRLRKSGICDEVIILHSQLI
jgi:hypothetical protein